MKEKIRRKHARNLAHPKYRADIDGLRAIAVLAVVGYHAFPSVIGGGFVGVDIFFVISGFLISTIILGSLERNSFNLVEFYAKRIRRIFPALLFVLAITFLFGWFVLLPDEYKQLGRHIAGGTGFVSNFVLWNESGYFDNEAERKPLLHLWSLGIEEQFYLVWPLILWLAWKRRFSPLVIILSLGAASFVWNVICVRLDTAAAFYSPFTRFWELLAGAVLACRTSSPGQAFVASRLRFNACFVKSTKINVGLLRDLQSVLGSLLIAVSFLLIAPESEFPGWLALLPVAGAALIVSAGKQAWVNRVLLSNRFLVWVGIISFPLYLWHWPMLSFARIVEGDTPSTDIRIAVVVMSFAFAWLTYRIIERPMRFGEHGKLKAISLVVLMVAAGYAGINCYQSDGFGFRKSVLQFEKISAAINDWSFPQGLALQSLDGVNYYITNVSSTKVLFFGDSHVEQFSPKIVNFHAAAAILSEGGCPPIPGVFEDKHPNCRDHIGNLLKITQRMESLKTIVVGGCWNCYFTGLVQRAPTQKDTYEYYFLDGDKKIYFRAQNGKELALRSLKFFLETLNSKYTVYLLLDNPNGPGFDPQNILGKRRWIFGSFAQPTSWIEISKEQIELNEELRAIGNAAGVNVIDQMPYLCRAASCVRVDEDGRPIYKDSNHLRPYYVIENGNYLDQALLN